MTQSKHLVNIYKEAKAAYRERKAELGAVRKAEFEEKRARRALEDFSFDDDRRSNASSRRSSHSGHPRRSRSHRHGDRPPVERGFSDSFYENDNDARSRKPRPSRLRFEIDNPDSQDGHRNELIRRHSDGPLDLFRSKTNRSSSDANIDMDLAYGDLPPPLPVTKFEEEAELRNRMSGLTRLLEEANCLQHSVTATIEALQKEPDRLAAVALTLAEISNLAGKMAPSALGALKSAFPAVMALLASPQFMIAAGVGVGITVVALGGYKIVKKIKQQKMEQALNGQMEMPMAMPGGENELKEMPEDVDLDHIELWRRGIADVQANSIGTSVDGEFITPGAERRLIEEGVLREGDAKSVRTSGGKKHKSSKSPKSTKSGPKSVKSSKSSKSTSSRRDSGSSHGGEKVRVRRKKQPSGLRMLFT